MLMKLVGGSYLWVLITIIFFRWAGREYTDQAPATPPRRRCRVPRRQRPLTTQPELGCEGRQERVGSHPSARAAVAVGGSSDGRAVGGGSSAAMSSFCMPSIGLHGAVRARPGRRR